jgi:hypothetical protein
MKRSFAAISLALLLGLAPPSAAQELVHGTWTGTMTPPGGRPFEVTYQVGELGGALAVTMHSILVQEVIPFRDIRLAGDELTFWWEPGVRVDCTLRRTASGSFEGPCAAQGGAAGALTMIPPSGRTS